MGDLPISSRSIAPLALSSLLIAVTAVSVSTGKTLGHQEAEGVPEVIRLVSVEGEPDAAVRTEPAWVSANLAIQEDRLQRQYFARHELRSLRLTAQRVPRAAAPNTAEPGCSVTVSGAQPPESLRELAAEAPIVLSGRVVGEDQGFYFGRPNTLYRIRVGEVFRAPEGFPTTGTVLTTFPKAQLSWNNRTICREPRTGDRAPTIGLRVFVFTYSWSESDRGVPVLSVPDVNYVFETAEGTRVVPGTSAAVELPDWSDVEQRTRRILESQ